MEALASKRPPKFQGRKEGGYYYYGKRVVFLEHERGDERYDRDRLEAIARNMNNRIERGIWCPSVIGHTSKYNRESDHGVVGYFGPYEVVDGVGPEGEAGIVAGQWSMESHPNVASEYPRVSAEIWPSENILDPISLLGGTTPYFDLPSPETVPYQKPPQEPSLGPKPTGESQHYEMAASVPGGTNAFIPGMVEGKKKDEPDQYMNGDAIPQIIQILKPQIAQMVAEEIASAWKIADLPKQEDLTEPAPGEESLEVEEQTTDGLPAAEAASTETEPIKTSTGPDSMDESADIKKMYMRGKLAEFATMEDGEKACEKYMASLDGSDKDAMASALEGEAPEGEKEFYSKAAKYMHSEPDGDEEEGEEEGKEKKKKDEKEEYARDEAEKVEYEKLRGELAEFKQKYQRTLNELDAEKEKARAAEDKALYSKRFGELEKLAAEFVLDPAAEMEDAADLSEAKFERLKSKIKTNYQRVPNAGGISTAAVSSGNKSEDEQKTRYQKRAVELASEIRNQGKHVDYAKIVSEVSKTDGKVTAAELLSA